jgi:mono/diheme cytochrome c family protein
MINTEWMRPLALALLVAGLGLATAACQPSDQADPATGTEQGEAENGEGESGEEADEVAEAGDPEAGKKEFATCAGCHGPDGKGLPNLGKDLHNNAFLAEMTDAEAVAFLKVGREATHPLNTTGVAMPPKGGNPALDDQDLANIVAYVRTLK